MTRVAAAMAAKLGASAQRPPAFSAVKVGGRTLHEAARAGEPIEAPARIVRVDRFDLLAMRRRRRPVRGDGELAAPTCASSPPTSGDALGVGAHLTVPPSYRDRAVRRGGRPAARRPGDAAPAWRRPWRTCRGWTSTTVEAEAAGHGRVLGPAGVEGPYGVYGPGGRLIGIWRDDGPKARPEMVLAPGAEDGG